MRPSSRALEARARRFEWNLQTQTDNFNGEERTTGTINPGIIYVADKFQLGVEAIIPVNWQLLRVYQSIGCIAAVTPAKKTPEQPPTRVRTQSRDRCANNHGPRARATCNDGHRYQPTSNRRDRRVHRTRADTRAAT